MNTPAILWFRLDLRLTDNPALRAALQRGGAVVPVFIWSPDEKFRGHPVARRGGGYINRWLLW